MNRSEDRGMGILPEADDGVIFYVNGSKVSPYKKIVSTSTCIIIAHLISLDIGESCKNLQLS